MPIIDLYSKRQVKSPAETGEVYTYDSVPEKLRNQIMYLLDETLGDEKEFGYFNDFDGWSGFESVRSAYHWTWNAFRREHGLPKDNDKKRSRKSLLDHFKKCSASEAIDLIELTFRVAENVSRSFDYKRSTKAEKAMDEAIQELNVRFQEHGVGYRYENKKLMRIDSEFAHQEVIKPALKLLSDPRFAGANDEFLKAHEDFRKGDNKDAVHKACNAFESVMKVICKSNGWEYDENAPAKKLIGVLTEKGLIKGYSVDSYNALTKLLENAIPSPRNKEAGHGQGDTVKLVPSHMASHVLNLTASTILYLVAAEKEMRAQASPKP